MRLAVVRVAVPTGGSGRPSAWPERQHYFCVASSGGISRRRSAGRTRSTSERSQCCLLPWDGWWMATPKRAQFLGCTLLVSPVPLGRREMTVARDGEEFAVRSNEGDWLIAWHSPTAAPEGMAHGANAFCVTADNHVVLISGDGERWGWPGGRPEGDESWEQTLRREVLEESCAAVVDARLLGFCRAACLTGLEQGRVLVRSVWRAEVELMPREPRFEIRHRRVVAATELLTHLWMEQGFEPIYRRALLEAGLV